MARPTPYRLPRLTPRQQLTAGRLPRRLIQLYLGLIAYGLSISMMIRSHLGSPPWDVLHQGLSRFLPFSFGAVVIMVGALVLLAWIPLRQWPGLGTVSNVVVLGLAADVGLAVIPEITGWPARMALLIGGLLINGAAGAAYIGAHLGPGPRDGLMTGLVLVTGRSVRLVRTTIEVSLVLIGFLLGGVVGVGTIAYALGIGPLVQLFLPWLAVRLPVVDRSPREPSAVPG